MKLLQLSVGIAILGLTNFAWALDTKTSQSTNDHTPKMFSQEEMVWVEGPPSLPKGVQMVVLEGNPKNSGPFTMRIKVPGDFIIPPHKHPGVEHVTIISGSANFGSGEKFDKDKTQPLKTGGFAFMNPNMVHFVYIPEETVIQLHGIGPWDIKYIDPKDDPRSVKTTKPVSDRF